MNYFGFSFPTKGYLIDSTMPATKAAAEFHDRLDDHPPAMRYAMLNLVDSHDTDRLASMIVNAARRPYEQPARFDYDISVSPRHHADYALRKPDARERRIQRMVALLQMTYLGAPMVYYGTEAGMWGADDPCDRMPMVWPDLAYEPQAADPKGRPRPSEAVAFDQKMFDFYRAAIALRKRFIALRRGEIEFLPADDAARFLAFRRTDGGENLVVGINRGDAAHEWRVPTPRGGSVQQLFVASGEVDAVKIRPDGDATVVTVPPLEGVVLRVHQPE
jgi:glycosidase